ncbi:hypothetical protein BX070DRAFT_223337 [Coemansia spiralis]|nr:hypothetical protein BX070DRAFT_223337 [Coemansia spiralis]
MYAVFIAGVLFKLLVSIFFFCLCCFSLQYFLPAIMVFTCASRFFHISPACLFIIFCFPL